MKDASPEVSAKALSGVATMLVDDPAAKDFHPILTTIAQGPNTVFGTVPPNPI
jgi:hypothetical protein